MNTSPHFFTTIETRDVNNLSPSQLQAGYICLIEDQCLLQANGDDAATFLHNQLSNDVEHLDETQARYAAYCTPKGRMQASFWYWKNETNIFLQCAKNLQPALQKRLQMFVMRSKVKLEDVSEQFAILGLGGSASESLLRNYFSQLPEGVNDKIGSDNGTLIRTHDAFGSTRYQWIVEASQLADIVAKLDTTVLKVDSSIWRLGHIHAGLPQIIEETKEKFVPQMVNFELIGGVNFKKGCYPGQEIVARSQYLGKLKRRMAIALVNSDSVNVAMEIFSENDPSQPCGMVVNVERNFDQGFACLIEIKLADQEAGRVHLGNVQGALLEFQTLPYAYLDITE